MRSGERPRSWWPGPGRRPRLRALLLLLGAGVASAAGLAPTLDYPGAERLEVGGDPPGAQSRRLRILGTLESSDGGGLRAERQETVVGRHRWSLWEVPRGEDEIAVFRTAVAGLEDTGWIEDWTCTGRACGSSNDWANRVFEQKQLYGRDQYQHYWTGRRGDAVATLYVVRRGNRRIYARIGITDRTAPGPGTDAAGAAQPSGSRDGWRRERVPGISLDAGAGVDLTGPDRFRDFRLAHADETLLLLVGADDGPADDALRALSVSQRKAAQLRMWLDSQGLGDWRVVAVGPALPELNRDVVLVVLPADPEP